MIPDKRRSVGKWITVVAAIAVAVSGFMAMLPAEEVAESMRTAGDQAGVDIIVDAGDVALAQEVIANPDWMVRTGRRALGPAMLLLVVGGIVLKAENSKAKKEG